MVHNQSVEQSHEIKIGAIMAYITIAVNMIAGLIFTPWMVDVIGQGAYGLYTLSNSLISIFVMDFGLSSAVTRFVSQYNAQGDQLKVRNLLGIVYRLFLIIDFVIALVLVIAFFFIPMIFQELTIGELEGLKVVYIITASFSVISFPFLTLNGILTSYEKFFYQKLCDMLNRIINIVLTIGALSLGYGLYALVAINGISSIITILLKLFFIKAKTPVTVNFKYRNSQMLKEILGFSLWSTVILIAQRFIFNIAPTILGAFSGSVSIAIFGVAATLEGYVYTFSTAINGLFLPKVSRMVAKEEKEDVLPLMIKVGRIQLIIIGLLGVGFTSIGKEFIALWMGREFELSYMVALFLIFPSMIELPQHIASIAMIALNKVKYQSFVYLCMAAINVGLSMVLTGYFGAIGAGISICSAYLFRTIIMNVMYYRILKINIFTFFKECHLKLIPSILFSLVVGGIIQHGLPLRGWIGLICKILLITFTYMINIWFLGMNRYEKGVFLQIAKKIRKIVLSIFIKLKQNIRGGQSK